MNKTKPKADPIFALIEARQLAEKAFDSAVGDLVKLEQALDVRDKRAAAKAGFIPPRHAYTTSSNPRISLGEHYTFDSYEGIEQHLARHFLEAPWLPKRSRRKFMALKREARAELRAMLDKVQRDRLRAQRKSGWTAAQARWEAAQEANSLALRRLCGTMPTTAAGLAALLAELQTRIEDGAGVGDFTDGRTDKLAANLARAAAAIARKGGHQ